MKNFKIYLKSHLMTSYQLLENEPIGMRDYSNKLVRHLVYGSVFVDVSFGIKFVKEGKDILSSAFMDKRNIAECLIKIDEYNSITNEYDSIFTGEADFNTYKEDEITASISFINSGAVAVFNKRNKLTIDTSDNSNIDGLASNYVPLLESVIIPDHEKKASAKVDFQKVDIASVNKVSGCGDPIIEQLDFNIPSQLNYNYIGSQVFIPQSNPIVISEPKVSASETGILNIEFTVNLRITSLHPVGAHPSDVHYTLGYDYQVKRDRMVNGVVITDELTPVTHYSLEILTGEQDVSSTHQVLDSIIIDEDQWLIDGDFVRYYIESQKASYFREDNEDPNSCNQDLTGFFEIIVDDSRDNAINNYKIDFYYGTIAEKEIACYKPLTIFKKLVQLITGEQDVTKLLDSQALEMATDISDIVISDKYLINGESLKISFEDLFKSLNSILPLGMWHDGTKFIIEGLSYFYNSTELAHFQKISNFTISLDSDKYYNSVRIGYSNNIPSFIDNAYEYNKSTTFTTPQKNKKTLDLTSPLIADTVSIYKVLELINANEIDALKEIKKAFMIACVQSNSPYFPQPKKSTISTQLSATNWLNTTITPQRNLIRQGLRLSEQLQDLLTLNFTSSSKDYVNKLETNYQSLTLRERDDVSISSFDTPLTEPVIYEFDVFVDLATRQLIKNNPHGYITIESGGVTYQGYIQECDLKSNLNKGHFKLIKKK